MKVEKTHREVQILNNFCSSYLLNNGYWDVEKKQFSKKALTKLAANCKNIKKQCEKLFEEYVSAKDDLQIDHCATDEKSGVMLMNENGSRQFKPEGEKKLKAALKALDETKVELSARITDGVFDLTDEEEEVFSGVLIPEIEKSEED